ncbi:MAG TPA: FecR family protein [Polyangiaceae bacterium]|nr:FecR family protein [Polyangiaceae bacterium]
MRPECNLGDELSAALEAGPSRRTLAVQRAKVLEAFAKQEHFATRYWVFGTCAIALALMAVVFAPGWLASRSTRELRGAWQGKGVPEKSRVVAPAERGEMLSFSDGSQLELGASAELTLSKLAPEQAHLDLARGHVDASIRKGTGRAWTLAAGPYAVRVVGTQFSVDWNASSGFFSVNVREGKVLVTGGELQAGGVLLGAGERIERQAPAAAQGGARESTGVLRDTPPAPAAGSTLPRTATSASLSADDFRDDFRLQATRGNYAVAIARARRAGFDRLSRELPAKDLLLLANTARYAGSSQEARGALLKLRERFPGTPSAAHAALLLASHAEDRDKDPVEAERWLRAFLTESPRGELAEGAWARLLAALLKRGAQAEAQQMARVYLRLHPSGKHVAQARAVLQASH